MRTLQAEPPTVNAIGTPEGYEITVDIYKGTHSHVKGWIGKAIGFHGSEIISLAKNGHVIKTKFTLNGVDRYDVFATNEELSLESLAEHIARTYAYNVHGKDTYDETLSASLVEYLQSLEVQE